MRFPPFELLPPLPPSHTATIRPLQIQSVDAWLLLSPEHGALIELVEIRADVRPAGPRSAQRSVLLTGDAARSP
jgi:hypothetical protein